MPGFGATGGLHVSIVAACTAGQTRSASIINLGRNAACSDCDIEAVGNDITSPSTTLGRKNRGTSVRILHAESLPRQCSQADRPVTACIKRQVTPRNGA